VARQTDFTFLCRLGAHSTLKHDDIPGNFLQASREILEVVLSLGQQERRAPLLECLNHIIDDELIAFVSVTSAEYSS